MFTGIVEGLGEIVSISPDQENIELTISSPFTSELKIDQSVCHNGVCLTVTSLDESSYKVTAIKETLEKTNLNALQPNDFVNLERCMKIGDRLDGHIVQGHVDGTAVCTNITDEDGSYGYFFEMETTPEVPFVNKGSVTINGVSLTLTMAEDRRFSVAIIPFTYEHTTFKFLKVGDHVNIEYDVIGKYVQRLMARK